MEPSPRRDRGSVDMSIQMLFGCVATILVLLVVFEVTAYWHARNVFDDAAAEGARIAAAFDGTCEDGVTAANLLVQRTAGRWADGVKVSCSMGTTVSVTVAGATPGVLGGGAGFIASATETAPKEG